MPTRDQVQQAARASVRWLTAFAIVLVVTVTIIGNNVHARGADAMFIRNLVERTIKYGGSYYENSIHNKGPIEALVGHVARLLGGYDGYWFVVSFFIAVLAAIVAYAAFRTAIFYGVPRIVGFAVACGVYIHFTLSSADYAGILYSRNITTALMALAWVAVVDNRLWTTPRTQVIAVVTAGTLLGLAVQTVLASVFGAAAIAIAVAAVAQFELGGVRARTLSLYGAAAGAIAFFSMPIWYLLRGSFGEFWAGWWTHARFQNTGIGNSLAGQFALGWDSLYAYYQQRPLAFLLIVAFVGVTISAWSALDARTRVVHVGLIGWLTGGWIELVLSQRYTSHYFSVTSVPTALMLAALVGYAYNARVATKGDFRGVYAWPLAVIALTLFLSGGNRFVEAAGHTSRFSSIAHARALERVTQPGAEKSLKAVLDLVSNDHDALLAWADDPGVYGRFRRTPATRFQQRYFIVGQIYGGLRSPEFVLPKTWSWLRDDLERSDPVAFIETQDVDDEQFAALVKERFRPAYVGNAGKLHLSDAAADALINGGETIPLEVPAQDAPGWTINGDEVTYAADPVADNRVTLTQGACQRIEGFARAALGDSVGFEVRISDANYVTPEVRLILDGANASSQDRNDGVFDQRETGAALSFVRFAVVVGRSSAALIVGDQVVAAAQIPGAPVIGIESLRTSLRVTSLATGDAPTSGEC